jgi:undecaprenyl pyrophosphate phosphatase UppP
MDTQHLVTLLNSGHFSSILLLYAGPDQILPLMSVLGGILGILLVFWQRFVGLIRRASQFFTKKRSAVAKKKV